MKGSTVVMGAVLVLWALAGCKEDEHYPPGEGGSPGGGGSGRSDAGSGNDAGGDAGGDDAGAQLSGELCNVVDLRRPLDCPGADLSGIDVVDPDSDASAETAANGTFTIEVGLEAGLELAVGRGDATTRDALVPAEMWDGDGIRAPRVAQDVWTNLIADIGGNDPDENAAIALYIVDVNGAPVADALVDSAAVQTFYDNGAPDQWLLDATTGFDGAALLLSVQPDAGAVDIVVVAAGENFNLLDVPVAAGHLTWARTTLALN